MSQNLSPAEFLKNASHYFLVDVRTLEEWDACHEEGALHIPLIELEERADEIPKEKPLAVACRTGGRSARACEMLDALGFEAHNLLGGLRMLAQERKKEGKISEEECAQTLALLG